MTDRAELPNIEVGADFCGSASVGYKATVVIATKNRREELRTTLRSVCEQSVPVEILVLDDGSTDGTGDMVRTEFSGVRLIQFAESQGYITQRNRGARLAHAPVIISLDDDAAFSSPQTVAQTLDEFRHPRVGAVAIPFVNVHFDQTVRQLAPKADEVCVTHSYVGTAHAVRRDLFLRLAGYREVLIHQGEESDFAVRMLAAGYVVQLGRADPIWHFESPRRDYRRMDYHGRRNDILFAWHNVPWPELPFHLAGVTYHGLLHGLRVKRPLRMVWGLWHGYLDCLQQWTQRSPISSSVYRLHRRLRRHVSLPLKEIEHELPAPKFGLLEDRLR